MMITVSLNIYSSLYTYRIIHIT